MTNFSQLIGIGGGNEQSSTTNSSKTRIPGSAIGFEKKITKQGMRKIIRTTRANGKIISSNELRNELIGLVKKAGTKGLSGKQLEKKLHEDYKMDIKDRKRVVRGIVKHWIKPEGEITAERREKTKRLNIASYSAERDKEYGAVSSSGNKIAKEGLGVGNDYNKSKFVAGNNNPSSTTGRFGVKLGGANLGNLGGGGRKPLGF